MICESAGVLSQLVVINVCRCATEVHVLHPSGWYDVKVAVGNLKSGNDEPDSLAWKRCSERTTNSLSNDHEMGGDIMFEIAPLVNFGPRNDQAVSGRNGID